jgi:hypothetical protein
MAWGKFWLAEFASGVFEVMVDWGETKSFAASVANDGAVLKKVRSESPPLN